jgi:drug/metabolite transporter (DMT)-like permease
MSPPIILAALAAVVIWGASPVAAKIAVQDLAPMTVAVLRTVIGGLAALPLAAALRIPLPAARSDRLVLLVSGFCGFVGFPVLFTLGVSLTSANHASMILAGLPVFTGAFAMAWDRTRPRGLWWAGCAVALAGEVVLIVGRDGDGAAQASLAGDLLVLASNALASLGYVAGGRLQRSGYPSSGTTFYGAAIFAVALLVVVPFVMPAGAIAEVPLQAWLALAYLAVGVTIIGYVLWYWALGKGGIERMGLFQFLQPVSGVVLAWLLLGEHITASFIAASGLVLFGVWLALRAK